MINKVCCHFGVAEVTQHATRAGDNVQILPATIVLANVLAQTRVPVFVGEELSECLTAVIRLRHSRR